MGGEKSYILTLARQTMNKEVGMDEFTAPIKGGNVLSNLSTEELKLLARGSAIRNRWGITLYHTSVRSRSAKETFVVEEPNKEVENVLKDVRNFLQGTDLVLVERDVCQNTKFRFRIHYYVTRDYCRLAHMFSQNFFEPCHQEEADAVVIQVPQWPQKAIYVHPTKDGRVFTFVLGSDYYGEAKMAALRSVMYLTREFRNGLAMHAGGKLYRLGIEGKVVEKGVLVFGLSGTGKTTITLNDHDLASPEGISILQDDIMLLRNDTYAYGTENSFYIKTDSVTQQPELFVATQSPMSIAENAWVDDQGEIDFDNYSLTTNGRCIVPRFLIPHTKDGIDLEHVDVILFNTRRYDMPPLGRLKSPEQAAAFFMLGESTITSADDPKRAGESKRVVAFNPFIMDNPHKEGHKLLDILRQNPQVEVLIVNTGKVGGIEDGVKISPKTTLNLILDALRGEVEWEYDAVLGYDVAKGAKDEECSLFDPYRIYGREAYEEMMEKLYQERLVWLKGFPGLNPEIIEALRG